MKHDLHTEGRNITSVHDGINHRSVYLRMPSDRVERTACGCTYFNNDWVAALHRPVDCLECIGAGA